MKNLFTVLAATLICGACLFSSCKKDEDNNSNNSNNNADLNLKEKLVGKWINVEENGQATPTNHKRVLTFLSPTEALFSISGTNPVTVGWYSHQNCSVAIDGDHVTVSTEAGGMTIACEYTVRSISDDVMEVDYSFNNTMNGQIVAQDHGTQRMQRMTADYTASIVGIWQGHCTSEGSEFDDGQEHRWEYRADGTYAYYTKNGDQWIPTNSVFSNYFVDGLLLCTRWQNEGDNEHREWWEIAIDGNQMHWTALRQNSDGTTYTATFEMSKVN